MSWNKWNTANLDLIWRPIRFAWIRIIMKEWLIRELTCQVSLYTRVPWPDFQKVTFKTFTKFKIKIHTVKMMNFSATQILREIVSSDLEI